MGDVTDSPRVAIERCRPTVDCGEHTARATAGLPLEVSADIFVDGFDRLVAWVQHGPARAGAADDPRRGAAADPREGAAAGPSGRPGELPDGWTETPLVPEAEGSDRWRGWLTPPSVGPWAYRILAMRDDYGTWLHNLRVRAADGQDVGLELTEGALMARARLDREGVADADRRALSELAEALAAGGDPAARIDRAGDPAALALMQRTADRSRAATAGPFPLWVDREAGGFSAWYELFPRSEGARDGLSGTLRTAAERLAGVAAMGFDIVYLPPIHPIGTTARRGRNNSDVVGPDDPGSPWAIGAETGGHTAVHPDLGTLEDFAAFVAEARRLDMEVALDYALQCSPEHPWLREHPEWFRHRPDGSIRHAENPPKRYFDIVPFDFDTPHRRELWDALLGVVLFWVDHGVRAFRVDNPHTKPFAFWEWLIAEVHRRHPDVIFLAEAFTRDTVRYRLAKVGFTQSYTDFTWRTTKDELVAYLTELSSGQLPDWFRPNFWTNTPDILQLSLQGAPLSAFRVRLVLAALTAPCWGMYAGFELGENQPVRPRAEDYIDSEKYELKPRRWDAPGSLAPLVGTVNAIRRRHRGAIADMRTLRIHPVDNDQLLCVSRMSADRSDVLVVVVNLDPHRAQSGTVTLDRSALGLPPDAALAFRDELSGDSRCWVAAGQSVHLDPARAPAEVLHLQAR